mgnify:CR=1 FL=1
MQTQQDPNIGEREDRFKRIATKRTNDILNRIRILGNCSNKSAYKYSEDEVNRIFRAIDQELKNCKSRFSSKKQKFNY